MAKRVLIVEDHADLRSFFKHVLVIAGFDVSEAGDGMAALRLIDSNPPDVILLDLDLPVLSGSAVRRELAASPHTRNIAVVVVTGHSGEHLDLHAAAVLRKPVTPEHLIDVVSKAGAIVSGV